MSTVYMIETNINIMYTVYRTFDIYILITVDRCVICVYVIFIQKSDSEVSIKKHGNQKIHFGKTKIKSSKQAIHIYVDE